MGRLNPASRPLRVVTRLALAYAVVVAALLLVGLIPIDDGPLGLAAILIEHIVLSTIPLVLVAAVARSRRLAGVLAVIALIAVVRFGGEWESFGPVLATGDTIDVATWNVEAGARGGDDAKAMLLRHPADIVMIEELTPQVAAAIERSEALTARWPYRALYPDSGVAGIGLLSAYPISDASYAADPVRLEAHLRWHERDLVVLGAHPYPARIGRLLGIPVGLDPDARNAELEQLRTRVTERSVGGDPVLLIGDFNTAPTEPAFGRLVSGLHDAHADAGSGPGWTWRPRSLAFLGIGLLRIDLILSTDLRAIRTSIDCPAVGDHCLVEATLQT